MEIRLLVFAIFLIFVGEITGYGAVSIFGFFLLFPALLIPTRRHVPQGPSPTKEQPKRITPPPPPAAAPVMPTKQAPTTYPETHPTPTYSAPLFPNTMFPTITSYPVVESKHVTATEPRDELLEYGILYALIRLFAG